MDSSATVGKNRIHVKNQQKMRPRNNKGQFVSQKAKRIFNCEQCAKEIFDYPINRRWKHVFCSRVCQGRWQMLNNNPSWRPEVKEKLSKTMKGRKTGRKPWNWNKLNLNSYHSLHKWVYRNLGAPTECEFCSSGKNLQWANKSHEYKHELTDWLRLCKNCHNKYDFKKGGFHA